MAMGRMFYAIILDDEKNKDLDWWFFRYKTESDESGDWSDIDAIESFERQNPDRRPRENYDIVKIKSEQKEYRLVFAPGEPRVKGRIYKMIKHI